MREESSGTRRIVLSELAKHDISLDDLDIFMQIGNAEAIIRTVAAGFGISFVSKLAAVYELERRNVVAVPVEGLNLVRTIYMVRKRLKDANRAQDAFWSFVHDVSNKDLIEMAGRGDLSVALMDL